MVFSLFNRKDKPESRRAREALLARTADSRPGPETVAAQREAARRTEEKINQIESEMIAAAVVARASAERAPSSPAAAARAEAPAAAEPVRAATQADAAHAVFGDQADAMAIDVNRSALPSVLEEAAILYSNGQAQPASVALRQALADPGLGDWQSLAWLMLLDLHRALGERAAFEALALEYAARFECPPPGWSDLPGAQAGAARAAVAQGSAAVAQGSVATARGSAAGAFAARLDGSVGRQVDSIIAGSQQCAETVVDFHRVEALDVGAAVALLRLLAHFGQPPGALVVRGAEALCSAARNAIEPGRRDSSEAGWMLALQMLRVLGRQQDFEDLSIEYCVTYEVSPPPWEPCAGSIRVDDTAPPPADAAPQPHSPGETEGFALRGDLLGRMQAELPALRAHAANRGTVRVDCRGLRRMEFVAAGDLLNEVVAMHAAGKQVQFVEPNYLVYALMLVMGIQELADIRRRRI